MALISGPMSSIKTRQLTPEEILDILRESHFRGSDIHLDSLLTDWLPFGWWIGSRELRCDLEEFFRIEVPQAEWRWLCQSAKQCRMRALCEMIAVRTAVEVIEPVNISGRACLPAGALLASGAVLTRLGIDSSQVRPSTPVASFLKGRAPDFAWELRKVAPGTLPLHRLINPWGRHLAYAAIGHLCESGLLCILGWPLAALRSLVFAIIALISAVLSVPILGRWHFERIYDFRDLSYALVHQQ